MGGDQEGKRVSHGHQCGCLFIAVFLHDLEEDLLPNFGKGSGCLQHPVCSPACFYSPHVKAFGISVRKTTLDLSRLSQKTSVQKECIYEFSQKVREASECEIIQAMHISKQGNCYRIHLLSSTKKKKKIPTEGL